MPINIVAGTVALLNGVNPHIIEKTKREHHRKRAILVTNIKHKLR
jgi:hypothetical protein